MRSAVSAGVIALAVLVLWAALTGRLSCLSTALRCVVAGEGAAGGAALPATPATGGRSTTLPPLPDLSGVLRNLMPRGWRP